MYATPEKLADAAKANVDSALAFANTALAGVERLTTLNLDTARGALKDGLESVKTLLAARNAEDLASAPAGMAKPAMEKVLAYSRAVYAIYTETGEQLSKLSGTRIGALKAEIAADLDTVAKSAPVGSEPAVAAFKTALETANSAYDAISLAAKQVGDMAKANVSAATETAVKALDAVVALPPPQTKKAA
jgi:phasin family protein